MRASGWLSALTRPRGDRRWDLLLRSTGLLALSGIPIILYFPQTTPLVWLAVVAVPANSPLAPLTPTLFEPIIMEAAKWAPALQVALVAHAAYMYTEYLNWHFYSWVLGRERLASLRKQRWVRRAVALFRVSPFLTVVTIAAVPFPFWTVRVLAILHGYALRPYLLATAIGRFPPLFLVAWLGARLEIPTWGLVAVALGGTALVLLARARSGKSALRDEILDASDPSIRFDALAEPVPSSSREPRSD